MTIIERGAMPRVGSLQEFGQDSQFLPHFVLNLGTIGGDIELPLLNEYLERVSDPHKEARAGFTKFMVAGERMVVFSAATEFKVAHEALIKPHERVNCAGRILFDFEKTRRDAENGALVGPVREIFGTSRELLAEGLMSLEDWNRYKKVVLPQALGNLFNVY